MLTPGIAGLLDVSLETESEGTDLVVLQCSRVTGEVLHIEIVNFETRIGEEVFVEAWSTRLPALLARGNSLVDNKISVDKLDFYAIPALAKLGLMRPLVS